jgi:hypothetical protein
VVLFLCIHREYQTPLAPLYGHATAAAPFRGRVRIAPLGFVESYCLHSAGGRAGDGRQPCRCRRQPDDPEAADHGTQSGSYQAILILHRR